MELQKLAEIASKYGLLSGEFTLSSGGITDTYYFDGRRVTLSPEGLTIIVDILLEILPPYSIQGIGGPTLGADAVVGATVYRFQLENMPIVGFLIRSKEKTHGTKNKLEGHLPENGRVAIFDDTITSGDSIMKAIDVVENQGCEVVIVTVLLDRQAGGLQRIRDAGYDAVALLKLEPDGSITPADIWDR